MHHVIIRSSSIFIVCLLFSLVVPFKSTGLETDDGGKLLASTKRDPLEAGKIAMKGGNPSVARAAFGAFLRDYEYMGDDKSISIIKKVGSNQDLFFRTALMIAMNKAEIIVDKLAVSENPVDRRLAALTMAIIALGDRLAKEKTDYLGSLPVEDDQEGASIWKVEENKVFAEDAGDDKKKKKAERLKKKAGKKAKPKKKMKSHVKFGSGRAIVSPSYDILKKLLNPEEKDKLTLSYALLAAAYSGDPGVKEAVDAIEAFDDVTHGAKLLYASRTGNPDEAAFKKAFEIVAKIKNPAKTPTTAQSECDPSAPGAALVCQAISETKNKKYLSFLHKALFMPDYRIQVDAARAIRVIGSPDSLDTLWKRLVKCEWPVTIEVCNCLAFIRDKRSIPILLAKEAKEKDRVLQNIRYALAANTGFMPDGKINTWKEWWAKNKTSFGPDEKAKAEMERLATEKRPYDFTGITYGWFYSIPIYSRYFCYVVDSSASMHGDRMDNLRENFKTSVEGLSKGLKYNIVDFGGDVEVLNSKALFENKKKMLDRIKKMDFSTGTRSFDAIYQAIMLPEIDAVYFLSDGAPVWGEIQKWEKIMWAMNVITNYRMISINAVDFFPSAGGKGNMERLYMENDGLGCSVQ